MTEHMQLKGYSPKTIKSYVNMVAAYARHLGKKPESTDGEDIRAFWVVGRLKPKNQTADRTTHTGPPPQHQSPGSG